MAVVDFTTFCIMIRYDLLEKRSKLLEMIGSSLIPAKQTYAETGVCQVSQRKISYGHINSSAPQDVV
jgi:hypothetical protein